MARSNNLHSVAAIFDTPNKIIKAAEKVRDEGYKKFDVNTPYPLHGMDKAMGLSSSKVGFVTLFCGLFGGAFILLFMWWTLAKNYQLFIGGKPFFALPAFIPITFETTVLIGAVSTFIALIAVFFKLPFNNHPLHDTDYMETVSVDKYGIYITTEDPKFDKEKIISLFESLGAVSTELIYLPKAEKFSMFNLKFILFLIFVAAGTSGSTYLLLNKLMYITPFDWMEFQEKSTPQETSLFFADRRSMRTPVDGTVAKGFIPYPYKGIANPTEVLSNPTIPTEDILKLGKKKYLTFCSPCHGNFAEGDSRMNGQFPNGPTLHSDKIIKYSDGMLYHIITNGQNAMPAYDLQITRHERWAIVDYIRVLQRAKNAKNSDLVEIKKESTTNGQ